MKIEQLISIALFTIATVFSVYFLIDKVKTANVNKEGFENPKLDNAIRELMKENEPVPTDTDAVAAHQTLLRYMKNDFSKGIRFAQDFGRRFFGENVPFRQDLDTRTLMDNYRSPLQ